MDIPAFSRDGMSGTSWSGITKYGTSKYDLKEVCRHFCREPIGPCRGKHIHTKSHSRWHSSEGNYKESRDSSDAKMVREGESAYGKSQRKSYRYDPCFYLILKLHFPIIINSSLYFFPQFL